VGSFRIAISIVLLASPERRMTDELCQKAEHRRFYLPPQEQILG